MANILLIIAAILFILWVSPQLGLSATAVFGWSAVVIIGGILGILLLVFLAIWGIIWLGQR